MAALLTTASTLQCPHGGSVSIVSANSKVQAGAALAARHMTLGLEVIKFMLEQDPANLPIIQRWIDKWTWRGMRLLTIVAMLMDYMLRKRVISWKEAWEVYFEENGMALFNDLARYGVKVPDCAALIKKEKDHISHQAWNAFYTASMITNFHTWLPSEDEMNWLSSKYPESFDKYYRPRFEYYRQREKEGKRFYNKTLPMLCQVTQGHEGVYVVVDPPQEHGLVEHGHPGVDQQASLEGSWL